MFSFTRSSGNVNIQRERDNIANLALGIASIMFFTVVAQYAAVIILAIVAPTLLSSTLAAMILNAITMYGIGMPASMAFFKKCKTKPMQNNRLGFGAMLLTIFACFGLTFLGSLVGSLVDALSAGMLGTTASNPVAETTESLEPWAILLFMVILAPIFEEIFFRRVVVDRLRRYGDVPAIIFSGLAFGLIHGNFSQFFYATFLGMVFAAIYIHTGKLGYTIFLHMLVNFIGGFYTTIMVGSPAEDLMSGLLVIFYLFSLILTIPAFLYLSGKIKLQKGPVTLSGKQSRQVLLTNIGFWLAVIYLVGDFATSLLIR